MKCPKFRKLPDHSWLTICCNKGLWAALSWHCCSAGGATLIYSKLVGSIDTLISAFQGCPRVDPIICG